MGAHIQDGSTRERKNFFWSSKKKTTATNKPKVKVTPKKRVLKFSLNNKIRPIRCQISGRMDPKKDILNNPWKD